jgi:glucoamylase
MMQALAGDFGAQLQRVLAQWHRVLSPPELVAPSTDNGRLMRISHNVLLTHEDKTYPGAFIASLSIPWGQAKTDDDLGGYHLVWTRDMVQSATALLACGRMDTAMRALVYLACTQRTDGSFAQNFWIDGTPYWTGIQLDEVGFPIMLAWRLWKMGGLGNFDVYPFVMRAAAFLVRNAPVTQQERWEEMAGYSPSTLASVIAGLICAAELSRAHDNSSQADFLDSYADWISSHLEEWTMTNDGVLHPDVKRHYVRVNPPLPGDPYAMDLPPGMVRIANRGPGQKSVFEAREIVDAGFLELVRYGVRRADDPLIADSLKVVDKILKIDTQFGPCWRRYNHDGYGQDHDGSPFITHGQGRAWPLLSGERGHYELAAGGDVKTLIRAMEQFTSDGGMICEQIWDEADKPEEHMCFGRPSGSAMPLAWAHAEYLKLLRSVADGRIFDQIPAVVEHFSKPRDNKYEFWKLRRHLEEIEAGKTLRITARDNFRVDWTLNGWTDTAQTEATSVLESGHYADIPIPAEQTAPVSFTLYWLDEQRWEGRDYDVQVTRPKQPLSAGSFAPNQTQSQK